jgi:uroporphyrinogen decarboxylase
MMTHRERILAALSHEQPDMVPIDFGGTVNSSIVVEGYQKLLQHFGIEAESRIVQRMTRIVEVDERILSSLDIDTRAVFTGTPIIEDAQHDGPRTYRDQWGVDRIKPTHSFYYDQINYPLAGAISPSDILNYPWPDPDQPGLVQGIKERVQWIREDTDCAVVLRVPAPFVHVSQYLRGFEDWYCDLALNPALLEMLFDAILDVTSHMCKRVLQEVGQDVDVIVCGDDLGGQQRLQMRHEHYLKYIKPRHAKYFRQIHELSPAKFLFHTCGSVASIIDDLIEIGVDALNPVQVAAKGMDPVALKPAYRGRMAFWGAMDTQHVLPHGSVQDVQRMVEERIEQMGEGGGYVLAAVHNLQPDVPVENIIAMFRHTREYVPSFARS